MPASLIVSALGLEAAGFAAAAVTFGVRVVATLAISSLLAREQDPGANDIGSSGGRVQLPPATENKLPIVYGNAYANPIIVDAKISTDQQTMWYVLAFSEATDAGTFSFGDVYWDGKVLLFDENNPSEIVAWYDENSGPSPQRVTGVAGKISMWFFNGSGTQLTHRCRNLNGLGQSYLASGSQTAIELLQDSGIDPGNRWTSTDTMSNTIFAVMRVNYDADHGVTGLGTIRAQVKNTLGRTTGAANGTGPGSVIKDYLNNDRYGCGVALANIDTTALDALDSFAYSNGSFTLTDTDGATITNTYRYRINGIVDAKNTCLSNLNNIASSVDSWIQWNELTGKWGVTINRSLEQAGVTTSTMTVITADKIIGGINVVPTDLNSMGNAIRITFPNEDLFDQTDFRYYELDAADINPNEPVNEIGLSLPFVNNSIQATWLGYKRLWSSRSDIAVNFTMDYSGIRIDAGDIIAINHEWYGWSSKAYGNGIYPGKPFRVTQVREIKQSDGFLAVQITATEYNDDIFQTSNPHFFSTVSFSGISDPSYIPAPPAPTIPAGLIDLYGVTYVVQGQAPSEGNTLSLEFWYSVKGEPLGDNNYTLYGSTNYSQDGSNTEIYPVDATEQIRTYGLTPNTYYWRVRAIGEETASPFSDSVEFVWAPIGKPVTNEQIYDNTITGSKVVTGDPAKEKPAERKGFFDEMGPLLIGGLAAASLYGGYKKGWFDDLFPSESNGNDWNYESGDYAQVQDIQIWSDIVEPNAGQQLTYNFDVTPVQPEPYSYFQNVGFTDYGYDSNDGDFFGDWI
jgi:hypothetical protein